MTSYMGGGGQKCPKNDPKIDDVINEQPLWSKSIPCGQWYILANTIYTWMQIWMASRLLTHKII